jgi:hypothetical protein
LLVCFVRKKTAKYFREEATTQRKKTHTAHAGHLARDEEEKERERQR